ncbi:hypothetical protein BSPWISOX_3022 [uncultured Gammaproteobacteria bacterium]|nr:hypothetical protein BSPWISOX_3022 [uncultured Gammaproteobacteria bacterium]
MCYKNQHKHRSFYPQKIMTNGVLYDFVIDNYPLLWCFRYIVLKLNLYTTYYSHNPKLVRLSFGWISTLCHYPVQLKI